MLADRIFVSAGQVINVASEAEHADETVCSLNFGQCMALVESRAAVVVGSDARADRAGLQAALDGVRTELGRMQAEGMGGRFGAGVAPSEARSFEENRARLALEEKLITSSRSRQSIYCVHDISPAGRSLGSA